MPVLHINNRDEDLDQSVADSDSGSGSSCSSTTLSFLEDSISKDDSDPQQTQETSQEQQSENHTEKEDIHLHGSDIVKHPEKYIDDNSSKESKQDQFIKQQQQNLIDTTTPPTTNLSLDERHSKLETFWAETLAHGATSSEGKKATSTSTNPGTTKPTIQTRKWDGKPIDLDDEELLAVIVDDDDLEDEDEEFERLLLRNLPSSATSNEYEESGQDDSRPSLPALDSRCGKFLMVSHRGAFQRQGGKEISGITMDTALEEIVLQKRMLDEDNESRPGLPDRRTQRTGRFLVVHHQNHNRSASSHPLQQQISELGTSGLLPQESTRFQRTSLRNTMHIDNAEENDTYRPQLPHRIGSKCGKVLVLNPKEKQISAITLEDGDFASFLVRVRKSQSRRRDILMGDQDDKSQPKLPVRENKEKKRDDENSVSNTVLLTDSWDVASATASPTSSTSDMKKCDQSMPKEEQGQQTEWTTCGCFPRSRRRTSRKSRNKRNGTGLKVFTARSRHE